MTEETLLKNSLTVNNAIITLGDTDDSGKGRHFKSRFIQPGLAGYPGQFGNALIKKENLDKFVHTLRNKPVTINHKDNIGDDDKVGEVLNVWYNPEDGWYWCDGIITDETAINLINDKKWSVSCSYDFTKYNDEGGTENNIPYDIEFLDGEFNHLAIVDNPRYEGANIVFNSKAFNINNYRINQKRDKYGRFTCEGKSSFFNSWKDAPEFELKQNELHQYIDDIEELRKQSKKYYHTYLQGKPIEREELGEIRVSGKGLDEYFHFSSDIDKLLAVPMTPELIKKGKLGEFEEDYKGRNDNIVGYYPIYANLKTSNGIRKAELLIAKDKDGKLFYQMFLDFDRQKAQERALKKEATAGTNPPASNSIINDINSYFNPNVKEQDMNIKNWNEQDHPRDEQGKFTEKGTELKSTYKDIIEKYDKKYDVDKNDNGESWYDRASERELKTDIKEFEQYLKTHQEEIDRISKLVSGELLDGKYKDDKEFSNLLKSYQDGIRHYTEKLEYAKAHLKKKQNKADNSKEQDMALLEQLKELITKVENDKGENMDEKEKVDNEKVDKRKLIDEVGGILKGKVDDEIIRTIMKKMEEASYDDSEASADNKKVKNEAEEKEDEKKAENKKVKNEDEEDKEKVKEIKEEVKEDVENKCKNSVDNAKEDYFEKMRKIYNSAIEPSKEEKEYTSRADRLKAAEEYFKV